MISEMLVEITVKEALRKAEKNRVIEMASRSRKIQNRQRLVKLARRFGLTPTWKRVKAIMSRQQFDIKDVSLAERIDANPLWCGPETKEKSLS